MKICAAFLVIFSLLAEPEGIFFSHKKTCHLPSYSVIERKDVLPESFPELLDNLLFLASIDGIISDCDGVNCPPGGNDPISEKIREAIKGVLDELVRYITITGRPLEGKIGLVPTRYRDFEEVAKISGRLRYVTLVTAGAIGFQWKGPAPSPIP